MSRHELRAVDVHNIARSSSSCALHDVTIIVLTDDLAEGDRRRREARRAVAHLGVLRSTRSASSRSCRPTGRTRPEPVRRAEPSWLPPVRAGRRAPRVVAAAREGHHIPAARQQGLGDNRGGGVVTTDDVAQHLLGLVVMPVSGGVRETSRGSPQHRSSTHLRLAELARRPNRAEDRHGPTPAQPTAIPAR